MDRSPEFHAHQGLTLYFLGKLHSGLKKLSAYYRQRGVKVFNVTTPEELERAIQASRPHALVIDLQSRSDITLFFDALGQHEGLIELPRVAIISSNTGQETAEALTAQADESVIWPLKATDLSLKLFNLLVSRGHFVRFQRGTQDEDGRFLRGELYPSFLRDVVQLLYLGRKDSILSLESEGRRGNLYFKEGKLIDAQVGALEWEDSLGLVRRFRSGTFVLSFQPVDRKKFIDRNITAWLAQQEDDVEAPSAPEPGEATAVGPVGEATDAVAPHTASEARAESPASMAPAASELEDVASGPDGWSGPGGGSADPMMPPPPSSSSQGARATHPRPVEAGQAGRSGAPGGPGWGTAPEARPTSEPGATPPGPYVPPSELRGREFKVAVALLVLVLVALGSLYYYRSLTVDPTPVARVAPTPVATPAPTPAAVPVEPSAATPRPAPTGPAEPAVSPPTDKPVVVVEQRAPRVKEIVEVVPTPVPTPRVSKPTPTPAPEPARTTTVARIAPVPTPTPAPVATPAPTPEPVAKLEPLQTPEPAVEPPLREKSDRNLRKARELEKAGKLQEALVVYTQIAELDPSSREASEAISRLRGSAGINPMAPGEIHINAFPYGIAYVDGEKWGYTPVHLMKVTPRKYLIRVVNPDYGACSTEVVIKPGERKWVHLRLDDAENCQRSRSTP